MFRNRPIPALLAGTMLAGLSGPLAAQTTEAPVAAQAQPAPAAPIIISQINVVGSQRIEPDTVRSYVKLKPGEFGIRINHREF